MNDATIWNPKETSVGGTHAFFIVRGDPRTYNLPRNPEAPTRLLKQSWSAAAVAAGAMLAASIAAFALSGRNAGVPPAGPAASRRRGAK
jgi:hypothetical protein